GVFLRLLNDRRERADLDRADDAVFDVNARVRAEEFKARLQGAVRFAVSVNPPARHERRMADDHFGNFALDHHAAPGDEQSVEREAAAARARDAQRVGAVGLPVEQSDDWAAMVSRPELQGLVFPQDDIELFDVNATVSNFDHGMSRVIFLPVIERGSDARMLFARADAVEAAL